MSLSARSGRRSKSSAVRGRLCLCDSKLWCRERERAVDEFCEEFDLILARCSLKWDSRLVGSSSASAMVISAR